MKTIKKINQLFALLIIAATLLFTSSCKKPHQSKPSPWHKKSSGVAEPQRVIIEMSTFGEHTAYGLMYDEIDPVPLQDVSITHDGGATWHKQTIAELDSNYLNGVAATDENTVHVVGNNYANGGGNVFRSINGGITWQREGANTYTDPASFPNAIQFFNFKNGVMVGDPQNGYYENYTTSDGGNTWTRVPSANIPAPLENEIGFTYFTDKHNSTVWTVTLTPNEDFTEPLNARLLQSDDMGITWYVRNSSLPITGFDGTIKFRNHSVGLFKNNGALYRTTDGGTTYNKVNYSGTWFSFDFDNVPGKPGWWISTGGGFPTDDPRSLYGFGSSISYDDGDHWITLDTMVNHTCVDMTSPTHGYSGGITTGSGNDGVFVYLFPPWHRHDGKLEDTDSENN